jgi:hypothetical protein
VEVGISQIVAFLKCRILVDEKAIRVSGTTTSIVMQPILIKTASEVKELAPGHYVKNLQAKQVHC